VGGAIVGVAVAWTGIGAVAAVAMISAGANHFIQTAMYVSQGASWDEASTGVGIVGSIAFTPGGSQPKSSPAPSPSSSPSSPGYAPPPVAKSNPIPSSTWLGNNNQRGVFSDASSGRNSFPSFKTMWDNYPRNGYEGILNKWESNNLRNKCAIRLSYSFVNAGGNISDYKGDVSKHGYVKDAQGFADYLSGYKRPQIMGREKFFQSDYAESQGIIFFERSGHNYNDQPFWNHIDLYNRGSLGSGHEQQYYNNQKISNVWFWELE